MKEKTELGIFLKTLQTEKNITLAEMASTIGVSSAFLSKVENGLSKPPLKWISLISCGFDLTAHKTKILSNLIITSISRPTSKRRINTLITELAKIIEYLTEEDIITIQSIILKYGNSANYNYKEELKTLFLNLYQLELPISMLRILQKETEILKKEYISKERYLYSLQHLQHVGFPIIQDSIEKNGYEKKKS